MIQRWMLWQVQVAQSSAPTSSTRHMHTGVDTGVDFGNAGNVDGVAVAVGVFRMGEGDTLGAGVGDNPVVAVPVGSGAVAVGCGEVVGWIEGGRVAGDAGTS